MYHSESNGYTIQVRTAFDLNQSNPLQRHFLYRYTVTITNVAGTPAKLMSRTWLIEDATGEVRKVEGPGVIGEHPWFGRGESFQYSSFCPLPTLAGKMRGQFHMRAEDGGEFSIDTPSFRFLVPEELIDRY